LLTEPGFVVAVEQEAKKDGQPTVFKAKQIPSVNSLPIAPPVHAEAIHQIDFSFGPVKECLMLPQLMIYTD
jgi:nucleoside-specific outer membrane channel protein Tsx